MPFTACNAHPTIDIFIVEIIDDGPGLPPFDADVLEAARAAAPGWDVHALEVEWRAFWVSSGRPRLSKPDKAFLGWLRGRVG